jgi:hypothetical protein
MFLSSLFPVAESMFLSTGSVLRRSNAKLAATLGSANMAGARLRKGGRLSLAAV